MTPYDQGYQDAIRHIYTALGMAITQPLDEDHALGYLKILKRERDEARAAYESETLSTAQMAKRITDLEAECTRLHDHWHKAEEAKQRAAKIMRRFVRYGDMVAEDHPSAVSYNGQCARAEGGIWLAEFDRQNAGAMTPATENENGK